MDTLESLASSAVSSSASAAAATAATTTTPLLTLTSSQEKVISILPIPSALLSIFGSVSIIRIACRTRYDTGKQWTSYTRLLIAISCCDIIYSITMGVSAFLLPKETSHRVWAIGNDTTCTLLGFVSQFFVTVLSYNGMLSFYFLLSTRLGVKNRDIARKYEPFMHLIGVGYPFITHVIGLYLGVFHENELGQGCWVNNYPENCGEDGPDDTTGVPCQTETFSWILGGFVTVLSFLSIVINNLLIYFYVKKRTNINTIASTTSTSTGTSILKRILFQNSSSRSTSQQDGGDTTTGRGFRSKSRITSPCSTSSDEIGSAAAAAAYSSGDEEEDDSLQNDDMEEGSSSSLIEEANNNDVAKSQEELQQQQHQQQLESVRKGQLKRLKLVASQAFLYVGAFSICTTWTGLLQGIQSMATSTDSESMQALEVKLYPILVCQAIFLPLQGMLNFCVYIRPKYIKCRRTFPHVSKIQILRHIVNGTRLPPPPPPSPPATALGVAVAVAAKNRLVNQKKGGDVPQCEAGLTDDEEDGSPMSLPRKTSLSTDLPSATNSDDKWKTRVADAPLLPVVHNLSKHTVSSITVSQGVFNDSTAENHKWEDCGTSEDATPVPPTPKRLPEDEGGDKGAEDDDDEELVVPVIPPTPTTATTIRLTDMQCSSITLSQVDEHETAETSNEDKWEAGGATASSGLPPPLPRNFSNPSLSRFPRVSSLEMISEVTLPSEFEVVPHDPSICEDTSSYYESLKDPAVVGLHIDDSASTTTTATSSSSLRSSRTPQSAKSYPESRNRRVHFREDEKARRWSAGSPELKDILPSYNWKELANGTTPIEEMVVDGGRCYDRMKDIARPSMTSNTSVDSAMCAPSRRLSPPPK